MAELGSPLKELHGLGYILRDSVSFLIPVTRGERSKVRDARKADGEKKQAKEYHHRQRIQTEKRVCGVWKKHEKATGRVWLRKEKERGRRYSQHYNILDSKLIERIHVAGVRLGTKIVQRGRLALLS